MIPTQPGLTSPLDPKVTPLTFVESYSAGIPDAVAAYDDVPIWSAPFGQVLLDNISYAPRLRALDIGCGTGFPLLELGDRLGPTSEVWGLDPWEPALQRAKTKIAARGLTNIKLVHAPAENMPFEDGFFDLIVSNNGLNNVQDVPLALHECRRIMRHGWPTGIYGQPS